jgi:uncharacterized protein YegJ (DUF2314 family)
LRLPTRLLIGLLLLISAAAQAQLSPNAPPDKPIQTNEQQTQELLKKLEPLIAEARRTYPQARDRFLRGLPDHEMFFVTTHLKDAQGHTEQVFIQVASIKGAKIDGIIASAVQLVSGYNHGDRYTLNDSDIVDWLISKPDGSEEGNLVGKFLDTYQP